MYISLLHVQALGRSLSQYYWKRAQIAENRAKVDKHSNGGTNGFSLIAFCLSELFEILHENH